MNARCRTMPYSCSWTSKKRLLANDFVHGGPKTTCSWTTVHWRLKKVVAEQVKKPTPPTILLVEWVFLPVAEQCYFAVAERCYVAVHEPQKIAQAWTVELMEHIFKRFRWWSGFFYLLMKDAMLLLMNDAMLLLMNDAMLLFMNSKKTSRHERLS